jgi:iron complex transport system ATP-binding protein
MSMIAFEDVRAQYDGRPVLDQVTLAFAPGKVTGIVGPNGAGKTSLLRAALGYLPLTSGSVRILNQPLAQWSREALARAIAYLPQAGDVHWPVTARHLVSLGRIPHRGRFRPLTQGDESAIDNALLRADATSFGARRLDELSAGERARVMVARALATEASILLADEPAAYLDPSHQLRLMELFGEEAARGKAVVVTLHDLALASRHCDEIVVLARGRIAAQGTPDTALSDAVLRQVFAIGAVRASGPSGPPALVAWNRVG